LAGVQSPHLVYWAITRKCNLSCHHCRGMTEGEPFTAEAKTLMAEIAELERGWVIAGGGE
jgi:MoaA/NifB/PqqE/SkfB family radical SAM enzyme